MIQQNRSAINKRDMVINKTNAAITVITEQFYVTLAQCWDNGDNIDVSLALCRRL